MRPQLHGYMNKYNEATLALHKKLLAIWHLDSQEQAIEEARALLNETDEALFKSLGWMSKARFSQLVGLWEKKNPHIVFKLDGEFGDNKGLERIVGQAQLIHAQYPEAEITCIFDQGNPKYKMPVEKRRGVIAALGQKMLENGINFRLLEGQPNKDALQRKQYQLSEELVEALNTADLVIETSAPVATFQMWLENKYDVNHHALQFDYGAANDQWLYQSYIAPHFIECLWGRDSKKMEDFFKALSSEAASGLEVKASAEHLKNYDYRSLLQKNEVAASVNAYQLEMKPLIHEAYELEFERLKNEKMKASTKDKEFKGEELEKIETKAREEAMKEAPAAAVSRLAIEIRDKMYRDNQQPRAIYQNFPMERAVKTVRQGDKKIILLHGKEVESLAMHSITPTAFPLAYAANGAAFEGPAGTDYLAYAEATPATRDQQVEQLITFILHEDNYVTFKEALRLKQPQAYNDLQAYESCYKTREEKIDPASTSKILQEFLVNYIKFKPELANFISRELVDRKYKVPVDSKKRPLRAQRFVDIYSKTAVFSRSQGNYDDQQPVEAALETMRTSRVPYMSSLLEGQGFREKIVGGFPLLETADESHPAYVLHVRPDAEIDMEKFVVRAVVIHLRDMAAHAHLPVSSPVYRTIQALGILEKNIEVDELIEDEAFNARFWELSDKFCQFSLYLGIQSYLLKLRTNFGQNQERIKAIETALDQIGEHSDVTLYARLTTLAGKGLRQALSEEVLSSFSDEEAQQVRIAYDNDKIEEKIRDIIREFRDNAQEFKDDASTSTLGSPAKAAKIELALTQLLNNQDAPPNLQTAVYDLNNPLRLALNEPPTTPEMFGQARGTQGGGYLSASLKAVHTFIQEKLHEQTQERTLGFNR